jgi:Flp pilus assembly protein TadD
MAVGTHASKAGLLPRRPDVSWLTFDARGAGMPIIWNNSVRYLLMVALLLTCCASWAHGQSESGVESGTNFTGEVRYENDTAAQFVQVELWTDGETSWRTITTTDRIGRFHVGAPCMVVQYKIETPGYLPVWGRVDMSTQPCRAHEWITLKHKAGPAPPKDGPASGVLDGRIAAIPPEAKTEFEAGQRAINDDNFSGAIPRLQKAIQLYARYAEAYQLLAVAQLQMNQGVEAEASLVKGLEIEDRMPKAQYLLGVLYAKTNRANLAEKPLTRFAELEPANPDAQLELAKVTFALNKFPDAESHARSAIQLKETNPGVYIVLGYSLLRQKKPNDARSAFEQYLKLEPQSPMTSDVKTVIAEIDQHARR